MCGICGILSLDGNPVGDLEFKLKVMSQLIAHRGPDDDGVWVHPHGHVGLAHRRLSIIDLARGHQPMGDAAGRWLTYNGEVYNYPELRSEIGADAFATASDTEVVLRAHDRWGTDALSRLRGMFAYGLWDEPANELVLARDRFGIKPLCYAEVDRVLYFASEAKAILPFLPSIDIDPEGFKDYLWFQLCLGGKTLFKGVRELLPGHVMCARPGRSVTTTRYWEVYYDLDFQHTTSYFEERIATLLEESVAFHLRSDVPVAAYLSGGLDSSVVASLAARRSSAPVEAFSGKFGEDPRYDESRYARALAKSAGVQLHETDIDVDDFVSCIEQVVYHLDYPVAGPGSFPQYVVSRAASDRVKVILGGQAGDEVFGGYTRYLIAYFEQCIKAAIDGTMDNGNFVVTYESIIPNLTALRSYKPLLQQFWREGLFEDLDARYFRLVNRAPEFHGEIDVDALGDYSPFATFREIFNGRNVGHQSYFDKMTHFDFKTLLPALLHVEDRVSMAHGLESRVPLLDHPLVELAATIPADIKFRNGEMKHVFKKAVRTYLPDVIAERRDKMGFPVPLSEWMRGPARSYVQDVFSSQAALDRELIDNRRALAGLDGEQPFGRQTWGLLCLELWQRAFHDREHHFKGLLREEQRRMKVLITGGGGFIGSNLADRLLAGGHEVLVIDNYSTGRRDNLAPREGLVQVEATIVDRDAVDRTFGSFAPDHVVHAAASYKDPDNWREDARTNVEGTANVVRAAQEAGVGRFVYFQTALCYGTRPIEQPITLAHPIRPDSSYAISKTAGEQYIQLSGLDFVSFRLANAYGPRNISGPLPTFFHRLTEGKPCFVMDTRRDFMYIDDLVDIVVRALAGEGHGHYHVSSGSDFAIKELFDATVSALGIDLDEDVEVRPRTPDDAYTILLDPSRTHEDFPGWRISTPLADGVARTIDYYREYGIEQTYTHLKALMPETAREHQ